MPVAGLLPILQAAKVFFLRLPVDWVCHRQVHSTFDIHYSTFAQMRRLFRTTLLVLFALALLSSCASTTTTSVGVTTNDAPKFHELGR